MQTRLKLFAFAAAALLPMVLSGELQAQQKPPQFPNMTFFITSTGGPNGANFGGVEGADKHCQSLAAAAGAGNKTWRAYLSTQGKAINDTPSACASRPASRTCIRPANASTRTPRSTSAAVQSTTAP